jgi:GNAT superfamily N-acetyltransferase
LDEDFSVRSYRDGDEGEVIRLLQLVFDGWPKLDLECSSLEHWVWKYQQNPLNRLYITLCFSGEILIGCYHWIPNRVKSGDEFLLCNLGADLAVHPNFRRKGVWRKMSSLNSKRAREEGIEFIYWISGNPIVIRNAEKLYPRFPHTIINLVRVQDVDTHFHYMPLENAWLKKIGFHVFNGFNKVKNLIFYREKSDFKGRVSEIHRFDRRINALWDKISRHYEFIFSRDQENLNWRFCQPDSGGFVVKQAEEKDQVLGYSVLKINRYRGEYPIGYIVDLITQPDRLDAAEALIADAVRFFTEKKINIVNVLLVKNHTYQKIFNRHGFIDSRIDVGVFYWNLVKEDRLKDLQKSPPDKLFFSWGNLDMLPFRLPS